MAAARTVCEGMLQSKTKWFSMRSWLAHDAASNQPIYQNAMVIRGDFLADEGFALEPIRENVGYHLERLAEW